MPILNIDGRRITVGDEFLKLSPEEQDATVNEIAASLKPKEPMQLPGSQYNPVPGIPTMIKGAYEALKSGAEATRDAAAGEVQDPAKVFAAAGLGVGMSPAAGSGVGLAQVAGVGKPMTPQMAQAARMMQEGLPRTPTAEGVAQAGAAAAERPRAGYFETLQEGGYPLTGSPVKPVQGQAPIDDILSMARSNDAAAVKGLGRERAQHVPAEWADVQSQAIERMFQGANPAEAAANYFQSYGALTPSGKRVLFGSTKDGKTLMRHLDTIHEAATEVIRAAEAAQPQAAPSLADSFGRMLGNVTGRTAAKAVTRGLGLGALVGEPVSILVSVLGAQMVSRALSNNAGAASTAAWSKAYSQLLRNPSPSTLSQFNIMTRNLGNTLGEPIDQKKLLDAAGIQVEELRT